MMYWLNRIFGNAGRRTSFCNTRSRHRAIQRLSLNIAHTLPTMPLFEGEAQQALSEAIVAHHAVDHQLSGQMKNQLVELVYELIKSSAIFKARPDINLDRLSLSELASYRQLLSSQQHYIDDPHGFVEEITQACGLIIRPLITALPQLQDNHVEDDCSFTITLFDMIANPLHLLDELDTSISKSGKSQHSTLFANLVRQALLNKQAYLIRHPLRASQPQLPSSHAEQPTHILEGYFAETLIGEFLSSSIPQSLDRHALFSHLLTAAKHGHGKTQLNQLLIYSLLANQSQHKCGMIIMDSQNDMINTLTRLRLFNPDDPNSLADRFVFIDCGDVENPPSLNLFDAGLDRLEGLDEKTKHATINAVSGIYRHMFETLLGDALTPQAAGVFNFLSRLMLYIPGATFDTLLDILDDVRPFQPYINRLDHHSRRFFAEEFMSRSFSASRTAIKRRIYAFLGQNPTLAKLLSSPKNAVDLGQMLSEGKIIFISTAKDVLQPDGARIVGQLFISLIMREVFCRMGIPADKRLPCYAFIEETPDYVTGDHTLETLVSQARKTKVGFGFTVQRLSQLTPKLRDAFLDCAIKFIGNVKEADAQYFAPSMRVNKEFFSSLKIKIPDYTEFAFTTDGIVDRAVRVRIPIGFVESKPRLTKSQYTKLLKANRSRICLLEANVSSSQAPIIDEDGPHRAMQKKLMAFAHKSGFAASLEEPVEGGFIDLVLIRDELRIAIEISHKNYSGYEITNIEKCLQAGYLCLMVSEHPAHLRDIRAKAFTGLDENQLRRVHFFSPAEAESFITEQQPSPQPEPSHLGFRTIIKPTKSSDAVLALKTFQLARFIARNIDTEVK